MKIVRISIVAVCLCGPIVFGQAPEPASEIVDADAERAESIPAELQDPAFDKYVSLQFVRDAWTRLDAAALADTGLQLAEGERILFRSHNGGLTAEKVLHVAVNVAAAKGDTKTLRQLALAAKSLGRDELAATVLATQKLGAQPRAVQPAIAVPLDLLSPTTLDDYQFLVDIIEDARIRGETQGFDSLAATLREDPQLPESIVADLTRRMDQARKGPSAGASSEALDRLSGASRVSADYLMAAFLKLQATDPSNPNETHASIHAYVKQGATYVKNLGSKKFLVKKGSSNGVTVPLGLGAYAKWNVRWPSNSSYVTATVTINLPPFGYLTANKSARAY